jgi:quinone-reactive Ni/Fe-hydrogenase small subunit
LIFRIENAASFEAYDCKVIAQGIAGNVVIVGPTDAPELLDTIYNESAETITSCAGDYLYSPSLGVEGVGLIRRIFEQDARITIRFNDQIIDKSIENNTITKIITKRGEIDTPFLIFGVGIDPNIAFARESLECDKGILVDTRMRTSDPDIYCVKRHNWGIYRRPGKECTLQADAASQMLGDESREFREEVSIDGLKVGSFLFADVTAPDFDPKEPENETILISHENRIDHYIVNHDRLKRFIGINTNIDLLALKRLIEENAPIDAAYLYSNRLMSEKGRLVCSCEGVHEQELIIKLNAVVSFAELKNYTKAGRTCGRCKQDVCALIEATPADPAEAVRLKLERSRR